MKTRAYHVSGVIQLTVFAATAEEAVQKAQDAARRFEHSRRIIDLDNICRRSDGASVGLQEAGSLDEDAT